MNAMLVCVCERDVACCSLLLYCAYVLLQFIIKNFFFFINKKT